MKNTGFKDVVTYRLPRLSGKQFQPVIVIVSSDILTDENGLIVQKSDRHNLNKNQKQ